MADFAKWFTADRVCLYLGILFFLMGYVESAKNCSFPYLTKPGAQCFCTSVDRGTSLAVHRDKNGRYRCCQVLHCPLDTQYEICAGDDPTSGNCATCLTGEFNFASNSVNSLHCQRTSDCLAGQTNLDPSRPCYDRTCIEDYERINDGRCVHKSAHVTEIITPPRGVATTPKLQDGGSNDIDSDSAIQGPSTIATTVAEGSNTDSGFEWSPPMVAIVVLVIIVVFVVVFLLIVCLLLHCGPEVTRRKVDAFLHRPRGKLCCGEEAAHGELPSGDPVQLHEITQNLTSNGQEHPTSSGKEDLTLNAGAAGMFSSTDPVQSGSCRVNLLDDVQLDQLRRDRNNQEARAVANGY